MTLMKKHNEVYEMVKSVHYIKILLVNWVFCGTDVIISVMPLYDASHYYLL